MKYIYALVSGQLILYADLIQIWCRSDTDLMRLQKSDADLMRLQKSDTDVMRLQKSYKDCIRYYCLIAALTRRAERSEAIWCLRSDELKSIIEIYEEYCFSSCIFYSVFPPVLLFSDLRLLKLVRFVQILMQFVSDSHFWFRYFFLPPK